MKRLAISLAIYGTVVLLCACQSPGDAVSTTASIWGVLNPLLGVY